MKSLSKWAQHHIYFSWVLLTIGFIILYFFSSISGFLLRANGLSLFNSNILFVFVYGLLIIPFIYYPSRKRIKESIGLSGYYFKKWKVYDLIAIVAFTLLGFNFGYDLDSTKISENKSVRQVIEVLSFTPTIQVLNFKKKNVKKNRIKRFIDKVQEKLVSFFTKIFITSDSSTNFELGLFITLYVALYIGLLFVLAALACEIACSGNTTLALVVFVGGQILMFFGLYWAIYGTKNLLDSRNDGIPDKEKNKKFSKIVTLILLGVQVLLYIIAAATG